MPMPETAVNKNNFLSAGEDEVWTTWEVFSVKTIPKAKSVNNLPDYNFWLGILAFNAAHNSTAFL